MDHTLNYKYLINSHVLSQLNFPHLSNNVISQGDQPSEFSLGLSQFLH